MTSRIAICCVLACLAPAAVLGQSPTSSGADRLSLDEAVRLALENNRQVQASLLQVQKAEQDVATARTRRLPLFETEVQASHLLSPVEFSFPQGAFGDFPGTGPIPSADTSVRVPQQPTLYVSTMVSQPITQLLSIGLGIRNAATSRDIEREHVRAEQLSIVNDVKRLYFAILQTESALAANEEAIALYRELDRTLQVRVTQRVALRSDALDVQFRLAQEEYSRTTYQNTLATQKEQLNHLLGRDVRTTFTVDGVASISAMEIDVEAAQRRALATRPDVQEARLKLQQADLDKRMANAERIPDLSLAVSYVSNFNVDVLPTNLATVGVRMTWEPFDWGRKRREVAAKGYTVEQARLAVREAEDAAIVEINSRYRTLAEKRALLQVTKLAQTSAREKLRVKASQYQVQAVLLPDVLQQRAELADADDHYQQALLAFWTAKADFEHALGEEVIP